MSDNLPPLPDLNRIAPFVEGIGKAILREIIEDLSAVEADRVSRDVPAGWAPVTKELLDSQEPWLYKPCWIALPSGSIVQGVYEWRQGRNPDRFYTEGGGDFWAFDATYVMPITPPTHPNASPQPQPVQSSQYGSPELQSLILEKLAQPVQAQPSGWQPIETAPKDGRTMLLGYFNSANKWRTTRGQWMSEEYIAEYWEEPDDVEAGWFETCVEADDPPNCWGTTPTHWMPLPQPPAEQAQKEE